MMLKRINKIRDFGIFSKFDWDKNIPDFQKYNLIYGWNYSGKSTISRLLRSFETKLAHPDYVSSSYELQDEQGRKFDQTNLNANLSIRVFNRDFIDANLKWDAAFEPILILGQANIALQTQLDNERGTLSLDQERKDTLTKTKRDKQAKLDIALTDKARDIKNLLSIPDYTRREFKPRVDTCSQDASKYILSQEDVQKNIKIYLSTDKKPDISETSISTPDLKTLKEKTNRLLQRSVNAKVIARLRDNSDLNAWVREGVDLHKNKTTCEFCGNKLPETLLADLERHFSKDYEDTTKEIDDLITSINNSKITVDLPDEANLYPQFQSRYKQTKNLLQREVDSLNSNLVTLITSLESKKTQLFTVFPTVKIETDSKSLAREIENLNEIIRNHNSVTQQFENNKSAAFETLELHYAAEFAAEEQYPDSLTSIDENQAKIDLLTSKIDETSQRVRELERQLSDLVRAAESINDYLKLFFGKDDLRIEATSDGKLKVFRSDVVAKNLSEGEKTAIAFVYFTTKLDEKGFTHADSIIFIDDPVSSLDSNHMFAVYSLIRHKLSACQQLFIATHSFEFLNLLKEWLDDKEYKKDTSFYLIERSRNTTGDVAQIRELHPLLRKYRSEYVYLFSLVYKFAQTPTVDFNQLNILPNIVRRCLEAFLAFKIPSPEGLGNKLSKLIDDNIEHERVLKFIHHFSHDASLPRTLYFPDLQECVDVVGMVLRAIEKKDKEHYDILVQQTTV
jgi:wobble nucleotide-excising tRNase